MFNIDQYLDQMRIKEFNPSETLIQRTKEECEKSCRINKKARENKKKFKKISLIALPTAAVLLIGMFLGAFLFGAKTVDGETAVAFYTVDINPSILINVNDEEIVTSLDSQNDDAQALISRLNCIGLPVVDAIREIVSVAEKEGFLDNGENYVLVGRFGTDGKKTEVLLDDLQSQLESELGDMISLLIVSGDFEDKKEADELNVSAGLLKLSEMAKAAQPPKPEDKVEDLIQAYSAPELSVSQRDAGIKLSWSELDFDAMGYTGEVTYKIVTANTKADVTGSSAQVLHTIVFNTNEEQTRSQTVNASPNNIDFGESKYYGIIAVYADNIPISSNIVFATMPEEETEPTPSPTPKMTPEPSPTPTTTPAPTEKPAPSGKVSGRVSGEYVKLSWEEETSSDFQGYKIVASQTNPNPKYPEDGYLKYITDAGTTSKSLYEGYKGLKANTSYYFSVTYLYEDGRKVVGNAVYLKVPKKSEDPDPEPTPAPSTDYASTNINGSISGNTINLSWDQISHSGLEGYKVMYSFTDSHPVYGDGSKYAKWITNAATTSCSLDATSLNGYSANATCYFSITALYESHSVKMPGNAISLVMPDAAPPEQEPTVAATISGSIDGTTVHLNWNQIDHSDLQGYKVVHSFTDSTPVYPENGYLRWITDKTDTSYTVGNITELAGYKPGATCYFSITAVYSDEKKPGNVISFTAP